MSKNRNALRAGLRALTNPMNLPDFAPGEYDEGWEPPTGSLADIVRHEGTIWSDEPRLIQRNLVAPSRLSVFDAAIERGIERGDFVTVPVSEPLDNDTFWNDPYIWGDEDLTPLQPLELDERRFNWRNFRFYALAFTGLVLSQTLIAMAVEAAR